MENDPIQSSLLSQSEVCASFGSRFYAGMLRRAAADPGAARGLFAPWRGEPVERLMAAAAPLRFLGALHELALAGEDPVLSAAFRPALDAEAAWAAALGAIAPRRERLAAFMAHEPQTNEVRRSACLLPGFLTVAAATRLPLRCLEVGASAGLNQLWDRFHYRYDGEAWRWGDPAAALELSADWRGAAPPPHVRLAVAARAGCDRKPLDLARPDQRRRLKAYIWPDQAERLARFDAAADLALAAGVRVEAADAADWALVHAAPREGVATVLYHSIFWQYLDGATQAALAAAMSRHGAAATAAAPLAWLAMEPRTGTSFPIELTLTLWPGGETRHLASVHAHGAWVDWRGQGAAALSPLPPRP
ncbi:MAG TPA: DUF2332 domain-containing protein [Caulobacteraceae bacterium]|nr:DUF2332 domain-containing protein [Caulobacteraceae bacterium]